MSVLLWKDLPAGAMLLHEGKNEEGDPYWSTTILLTDWGGGDLEEGTGFLALASGPPPSVYSFATACKGEHRAIDQGWILPRKRHEVE